MYVSIQTNKNQNANGSLHFDIVKTSTHRYFREGCLQKNNKRNPSSQVICFPLQVCCGDRTFPCTRSLYTVIYLRKHKLCRVPRRCKSKKFRNDAYKVNYHVENN